MLDILDVVAGETLSLAIELLQTHSCEECRSYFKVLYLTTMLHILGVLCLGISENDQQLYRFVMLCRVPPHSSPCLMLVVLASQKQLLWIQGPNCRTSNDGTIY